MILINFFASDEGFEMAKWIVNYLNPHNEIIQACNYPESNRFMLSNATVYEFVKNNNAWVKLNIGLATWVHLLHCVSAIQEHFRYDIDDDKVYI